MQGSGCRIHGEEYRARFSDGAAQGVDGVLGAVVDGLDVA